ncbi:LCP family glycopolymer transferase [Dellaglioa sp. BT-FLS60]
MSSRREEYQRSQTEQPHLRANDQAPLPKRERKSNHKNPRRRRLIWLIILILVIFGGIYAYKKYANAKNAADKVYTSAQITKARNVSDVLKKGRPISILLLGSDDGAVGRSNSGGRTDTLIVATLNPKTSSMTLVSLPRDAEVAVSGYESNFPSKLNSAYAYGGIATSVKTVEKFLNVPIDFYATINMGGLESLVDAVDGVDVKSPLTFTYDKASFKKGVKTHVNGKQALAYARMRHEDPLGDYGRQTRQRQIIMAVALKSTKLQNLLSEKFLDTMSSQMKTDLTFNDLAVLGTNYRKATHHSKSDHLQGTGTMINGESFEVANETEKQRITDKLRASLDLVHAETGNTLLKDQKINTTRN